MVKGQKIEILSTLLSLLESLPLATVTGSRLVTYTYTSPIVFLRNCFEITSDQEDQYLCMLTFHNKEKLTFES